MEHHALDLSMIFGMKFAGAFGHVFFAFLALLIVLFLGKMASGRRSEVPGRMQNFFELLVKGVYNLGDDVMGEAGRPYVPFIFAIGLYVFFSNLLGLIPGFLPPTANLNSTAAPAICVFILYQVIGFKKHGIGYLKHFMGPVIWLAPLIFVIEIIGHLARPLSLSMRLFGNIFGEEQVVGLLFLMVPFLVPLPMYFFGLFTSGLQAYVFMMLSMIYISGALEEAH